MRSGAGSGSAFDRREIGEEIRFHLEQRASELEEQVAPPEKAHGLALAAPGTPRHALVPLMVRIAVAPESSGPRSLLANL
jgi:hypothetical protein